MVLSTLITLAISSAIPRYLSNSSVTSAPSTVTPVLPKRPKVTYIPPTASPEAAVTKIFEYNGGGFEYLALRSNGQILATIVFPEPLLFYIDPLSIRPAVVLHNFTSFMNMTGITELAPDMFYVSGKAVDGGSSAIFSVDMRPFLILPNGTVFTPPIVKEIGSTPSALLLNGMTYLRRSDNFLLLADSLLGGVWKFLVDTGEYHLIIKDPSMVGAPNTIEIAALGINGLRTQNNMLFYCNSGTQTFYKMPLHPDGSSADKATKIASGIACDDFALDPWGSAYVASLRNALIMLNAWTGEQRVVAGTFNESTSDILGASSVRFGVGDSDRSSVYVTTDGGVGAPPGSQGVSRVDVGDLAQVLGVGEQWL